MNIVRNPHILSNKPHFEGTYHEVTDVARTPESDLNSVFNGEIGPNERLAALEYLKQNPVWNDEAYVEGFTLGFRTEIRTGRDMFLAGYQMAVRDHTEGFAWYGEDRDKNRKNWKKFRSGFNDGCNSALLELPQCY